MDTNGLMFSRQAEQLHLLLIGYYMAFFLVVQQEYGGRRRKPRGAPHSLARKHGGRAAFFAWAGYRMPGCFADTAC